MKRKTLCILIALAVLSLSALLIGDPPWLIGDEPWQEIADFNITFNRVPIFVLLYRPGHELAFEAMDIQELLKYSDIYDGQFVRFTGTVNFDFTDSHDKQRRRIELSSYPSVSYSLAGYPTVNVYPLDLPNPPKTYERGQKYEFTGFLVRYEEHRKNQPRGETKLRVYAFDIRPLDEKENKK